ncbi:MAG: ABC transporter permease [Chthoniobacterales bacterium]
MNAETATLPRNDFPDWISPMLVKELRQGMRTRVFVFSFILVQILMTLNVVIGLLSTSNNMDVGAVYFFFWAMVVLPVVFVLPFSGLGALSSEKSANTLELIFLTRLSAWRIVLGKWFAIVAQTTLFLCAVLPYVVLRYFMGGVNLGDELLMLAFIVFGSAVFTAVTVGLSPFQNRVTIVFTILGGIFLLWIFLVFIFSATIGSMGMFSSIGSTGIWKFCITVLLFGVLIILLMLQIAAGKVAPAAENHSAAKRLIGVAFLAATLILIALGAVPLATVVLALACCGPLLIGAVCDTIRWNHAVYRPFVRRGLLGRLLGSILYPGWPAGSIFALILMLAFGAILGFHKAFDNDRTTLIFAGAIGTVFFPAAITRVFFVRTETPLPFFIGTVAICSVFTILANVLDNIFNTELRTMICILPPCALIQSILNLIQPSQIIAAIVACGIGTIASLLLLLARSIPEWRRIRSVEKEIAAPADEPVA